MHTDRQSRKKQHFFDDPKNVQRVVWGLFATCVLLVGIDLFLPIHGEFAFDGFTGFYAAYGFVACVVLVLVAKYALRGIVKRDEDYYE